MSTPAQALTEMARGRVQQIVKPGASLAAAAQPLADPKRALGKYPYQWEFCGPNSKMAMPNGSFPIPQIVAPNTSSSITLVQYQVPEGYRFSLTDILINASTKDWNPGSGQLLFTLQVAFSTGPRNVEFLSNLAFP